MRWRCSSPPFAEISRKQVAIIFCFLGSCHCDRKKENMKREHFSLCLISLQMLNYNNPFSKKIVATELFLKQCCSPSQQVCGESKAAVSEKLITQEFLLVGDILKSHVAGMVPP